MFTATEAGLVTTSRENEPILGLGAGGQDRLPVVQGQRGDSLLGDLLRHLNDGLSWDSSRHHCLGLVEPSLHAVGEGHLFLCQGQGREEGDKRCEVHLGCDAC